ncbi:hypothetical protein A2U01_0100255, partial [Trifolium medium]|nr:hypothetical protein [Trifolium medium]
DDIVAEFRRWRVADNIVAVAGKDMVGYDVMKEEEEEKVAEKVETMVGYDVMKEDEEKKG